MLQAIDPVQLPRDRAEESRFRQLYEQHGRAIFAYALRRLEDPDDAADVLADTFLVAWRRAADVPAGDEGRLWLYGVARRVLANRQRGERRRRRLDERLRNEVGTASGDQMPDRGSAEVGAALARLEPTDRELIRLAGWEELSPKQIAGVLGISSVAARSRLHRARRRLRDQLAPGAQASASAGPDLEESLETEEES